MNFPWLPFLGFAAAASLTPGPNNVLVTASAARNGIAATLPLMLGIAFGFAAMVLIGGLGLAWPLARFPLLHAAMRWVGMAWLLFLAWQIATAERPGEGEARAEMGFLGGAMFQWVNPKAWLLVFGIASAWTLPDQPLLPQVGLMALLILLVCLPSLLVWAVLGAGASRLLGSDRRLRAFNVAMALLLVVSMVPIAFEE